MSEEKERRALARNLPARPDYEVGYAKPPEQSRFRPGVSGNPKGRPRGSKNRRPALHEERLKEIVLEEAYRTIQIREGERSVAIPIAQAVVRSLAVNAAKGRARAQELFTELLAATERSNKRLHDEWLETAIGYKVEWERVIADHRRRGLEPPHPLPHPDDIEIDLRIGRVLIKGPMTREEKARLDELRARKADFEEDLAECRRLLVDNPDHEQRHMIEEDIRHNEKILGLIGKILSGGAT